MEQYLSWFLHYSPYISPVVLFILFLFTTDTRKKLAYISIVQMCICNVIASKILKQIFKQPRPYSSDYGFPSSHVMFWSSFFIFYIYEFNFDKKNQKVQFTTLLFLIIYVSVYRYFDKYHSIDQIIGGYAFGIAFAACFIVFNKITDRYFINLQYKIWNIMIGKKVNARVKM